MHITIWQQFSSNHSSHFTVVGEFATEADAQFVYEEWRKLISQIQAWQKIHPHEQVISQPEQDYSDNYGIQWQSSSIDWFGHPEHLDKVLQRFGRLVLVSVEFETWQNPLLPERIMTLWGGKTAFQTSEDVELWVQVTCQLPDGVAEQVVSAINAGKKQTQFGTYFTPPWKTTRSDNPLQLAATTVDGQTLMLKMRFFRINLGLPSVLHYLQERGCSHPQIVFIPIKSELRITFEARREATADEIENAIQQAKTFYPWQFIPVVNQVDEYLVNGKPEVKLQRNGLTLILHVITTRQTHELFRLRGYLETYDGRQIHIESRLLDG